MSDIGVNVKTVEEGHLMIMHYDEYLMMDSKAFAYISNILSKKELSYILIMAHMLKTEMNALYTKQNCPHTIETLTNDLDLIYENTCRLLKKLVSKGILYKFSGFKYGQPLTAYLMNPFLVRKRKTIDKELNNLFEDFTGKENPNKNKHEKISKVKISPKTAKNKPI